MLQCPATMSTQQNAIASEYSYEDDFDARLRENFIITLVLIVCFVVCAGLLARRSRNEDTSDPLLCKALSAISLAFALCLCFVIPVDQILKASPKFVKWFGIDGTRFAKKLAQTCFNGNLLSLFALNPFAYLFAEASDGSWRSFWQTMLELLFILMMILSIAMLFFTRSTVYDMLFDPSLVLRKLTSLLIHIPGSLIILYYSPQIFLLSIRTNMKRFVPWKRDFLLQEASQLRNELELMSDWTKGRRGSGLGNLDELQGEITRIEDELESHPIIRNIGTALKLGFYGSLLLLTLARAMCPEKVFLSVIDEHDFVWSVALPGYFIVTSVRFFFGSSRIQEFLGSEPARLVKEGNGKKPGHLRPGSNGHRRSDSLNSLKRSTQANGGGGGVTSPSLTLASFVTLSLVLSSSLALVAMGFFNLHPSFAMQHHPLLLHPFIVNIYCSVFALRVIYSGLSN